MIKKFNNHAIKSGNETLNIQIRYADTQEQKSLKQQTQAARQFRSAEYEYATQYARRGIPFTGARGENEFSQALGGQSAVPIQNQRWAQSAIRGRSPLAEGQSTAGAEEKKPAAEADETKPASKPASE